MHGALRYERLRKLGKALAMCGGLSQPPPHFGWPTGRTYRMRGQSADQPSPGPLLESSRAIIEHVGARLIAAAKTT